MRQVKRNTALVALAWFLWVLAIGSGATVGADKARLDVSYGTHPQQKLDLYLPQGSGPHPFILYIHGGGWWNGDKSNTSGDDIEFFLSRGIAFAAINYRNLIDAAKDDLFPPLYGPLKDASRALQFLRFEAAQYGLDTERVATFGSSAGGFNALWLGLHRDQADPRSEDPVEQMSTDVRLVAAVDAQTSIDPAQMRRWVGPELRYGGHAFGLPEPDFGQFLARRGEFEHYFQDLSPAELIRKGGPPVFLLYSRFKPVSERSEIDAVHSRQFGVGFAGLAAEKGLPVNLWLTGESDDGTRVRFLEAVAAGL